MPNRTKAKLLREYRGHLQRWYPSLSLTLMPVTAERTIIWFATLAVLAPSTATDDPLYSAAMVTGT